MVDRTVEVHCPRCAAAVSLTIQALQIAPRLMLDCPGCARPFPAAAAALRRMALGIAPLGDIQRPFERVGESGRLAATGSEDE